MLTLTKLIVMVGLPASTKSSYAEKLKLEYDAVVLSSDKLREELLGDINSQDKNTNVFDEMNKRAKQLLDNGQNVIIDATNINRKRRIHLINNEIKADEYIVYYMNTPFAKCLYNDSQRGRNVGYEVINRMYKNMHIPTKLEGWDSVNWINDDFKYEKQYRELLEINLPFEDDYEFLFADLGKVIHEFDDIYEVPQDSTYHSFSISRHIYYTYKYIQENYKGTRMLEMLYASLFHDLGKGHCKSFYNYEGEEQRHANFIGHENVSAQLAAEYLVKLGYSESFVNYVVDLIQFHMMPMNASDKVTAKLKNLLATEQFDDLMFLHEADRQAH